ncbi:FecR family protein [Sphingomonas colocasiae]|uniref:FecR domain-containing protein n=1 Tax=Sphingomonas colocasiae TaxID=1848973 RepID=A0ABS7PR43_9SPHN|nr:FecR domain-containing protein [Sphingomonas colocasiae]MBY8823810.1 FecR domain-containing protein [Sphingomonas colocasiae]
MTAKPEPVDEEKIVEASVWVARLQSDTRGPEVERDFRVWLDASAANRAAFEMTSETWDLAGGARAAAGPARRSRRPLALALAASLAVAVGIGGWYAQRPAPIETAVGEQRSLRLADGSVVTLNTATALTTAFDADRRLVRLDRGEASFEVAKDSLRPFIVEAGGTRVVAVGTVFDVRFVDGGLSVTLAEGKVRVVEPSRAGVAPAEIEMVPGQRLRQATPGARPMLQAVNLQTARAWRAGQVVFGDTPLGEAVAEMNRYADQPIAIDDPAVARLRISGAFRATDSAQFARAVSDIYGLALTSSPQGQRLGKPR